MYKSESLEMLVRKTLEEHPDWTPNMIAEHLGRGTTCTRKYYNKITEKPVVHYKKKGMEQPCVSATKDESFEEFKQSLRDKQTKQETEKSRKRIAMWEIAKEDFVSMVASIEPPKVKPLFNRTLSKPKESIVLNLSDLHVGQNVMPEKIGGLGCYNINIFEKRLFHYWMELQKIFNNQLPGRNCEELNIFILGDLIEGLTIFQGQPSSVDLDLGDQIFRAFDKLSWLIGQLAIISDWTVRVFIVPGNHGRVGKKDEFGPRDNFDYLIGRLLEQRLKKFKNVQVNVSEAFHILVNVCDHIFHLSHGDGIGGHAGIPFFGYDKASGRYLKMYTEHNIIPEYYVSGHIHQCAYFGDRIVNGSWVGATTLSIDKMQTCSKPAQLVLGVNEEQGVSWVNIVNLISNGENYRPMVY